MLAAVVVVAEEHGQGCGVVVPLFANAVSQSTHALAEVANRAGAEPFQVLPVATLRIVLRPLQLVPPQVANRATRAMTHEFGYPRVDAARIAREGANVLILKRLLRLIPVVPAARNWGSRSAEKP